MELDTIDRIIDEYDGEDGILIQVLQDVQAEYNWLPKEALERVCERLGIPLTQAYSVASFYKAFSLVPRGRHIANVCMGTACHVRGAPRILEKVEDVLGIKACETTQDRRFSLERVNCLGCCALGPVMVIDGEAHGKLAVSGVEGILDGYE
ncbi:MAG: NAD(P)H-dependent oxidoreductase subunit E [Dehalococcoidia bacterium]|nr:MAG: NAD(P)H-dependent oxidoreductase subunit E [Dehalococcoidia bacterium]